ncbi:MAG: transcription-repair coupling factor [Ardenticatenaceae bacterium]
MANTTLHGLVPLLQATPEFSKLCADLEHGSLSPGEEPLGLQLLGAARPYVAAALARAINRPLLIITARPDVTLQFQEKMKLFLDDPSRVVYYPDPGVLPYERAPWSGERIQPRLTVLTELIKGESSPIVLTSALAILQPTIPRAWFERNVRSYEVGKTISLRFLLASWYAMGYTKVNTVLEPGQYAHRGGILDIFPTNTRRLHPIRIELWGDEVDSIRTFDPLSQRSLRKLKQVTIPPASEALFHRNQKDAATRLRALDYSHCIEEMKQGFAEEIRMIEEGERFDGLEFYLPYLYEQGGNLFDYLPENTVVLIDDWTGLQLNVEDIESKALERRQDMILRGELPPNYATYLHTWDDLRDEFSQHPPVVLGHAPTPLESGGLSEAYGLGELFEAGRRYGGKLHEAVDVMRQNQPKVTQILLTRQAERLAKMLNDEGVVAAQQYGIFKPPTPGTLNLVDGMMGEGFNLKIPPNQGKGLYLITDTELFGWSRVATRKPLRPRKRASTESFFSEIKEGDFVVHSEHGICIYQGLIQREISGMIREYLELEYAKGDKLYVPVHKADRVAKYVGPGDRQPTIHRLGTADWESARRRAKKAVEEIAEELLELYAARATIKGHAYSPDTPWQAEMEARFPFTETDDQLRAIEDVKQDMESTSPMDRLVVGDVGFGKTEVALRAAFKAVMESKQVAVLVPTTVLAQQHYNTFSQRLMHYPVNVQMLSRFRNAKEQTRIVDELGKGEVDIIIGTHRLLSQDVEFKDLGLLIIDEEQRFGVTHKEHLKQLRSKIDVLTLTATPIPRTLHMALTGVRDMSTIDTPPDERLPVVTKVIEWNDSIIRRAILREIDRGGQLFFVHNRVMSIYAIAQQVAKLAPEARITIGHGQMNEKQLETTMLEFSEGQHDILVCTSIIENGLDLPNVNTIIVDRADLFGLSQLYQLRGRVGRSALRGYSYFIHPRAGELTMEARERLQVMQEATELGSGFRIAMKDLEIRGAGDLLGAKQSGNIAAVGFDMYTKLLAQAIRERTEKGPKPKERRKRGRKAILAPTLPPVVLPLQAYLPKEYIADEEIRLQIYRRMAEAITMKAVKEVEQELRDRFGQLVEPAANLTYILRLRVLGAQAGATQISMGHKQKQITIQLPGPGSVRMLSQKRILMHQVRYGRRELILPCQQDPQSWQEKLEEVLNVLADAVKKLAKKVG